MTSHRLRYLPLPLGVSGVLLVLAAVVGGAAAGVVGAVGAAAGVALVAASYLVSVLIIAWGDSIHTGLVLPFGLGVYFVKIVLIGIVMAGLAAAGWEGLKPMGLGVCAGILGWNVAQIASVVRNGPHSRRELLVGRLDHEKESAVTARAKRE
ncbi:MAG: hypothetical protein ACRDXX_19340 [Stackebrandtia sp.]